MAAPTIACIYFQREVINIRLAEEWNTAGELLELALRSKRVKGMGHDSIQYCREGYTIRFRHQALVRRSAVSREFRLHAFYAPHDSLNSTSLDGLRTTMASSSRSSYIPHTHCKKLCLSWKRRTSL
ncbi:hypothetical protein BDV98DRAFT_568639 [Pterulicium gracile]|uniref:Uncharacterized protein n=1 Tax=Pterulicium gracile TaxID=1884261 RepID=A0A5C3QKJ0_9AGAR|nr:hypothetical protein BDV98DRAFT_568639 [Pterula gracilis]